MNRGSTLLLLLMLAGCAEEVAVGGRSIRMGSDRQALWRTLGEPDIVGERYPDSEFFYLPGDVANRESRNREYLHYYLADNVGVLEANRRITRVVELTAGERETAERGIAHYKQKGQ